MSREKYRTNNHNHNKHNLVCVCVCTSNLVCVCVCTSICAINNLWTAPTFIRRGRKRSQTSSMGPRKAPQSSVDILFG